MFPSFTIAGIVFSGGAFVITLVKDREEKIRYLLNFAGMRSISYIMGLLAADYILYFIPISALMLTSLILDIEIFSDNVGAIYGILLVFGLPFISFIYLGSWIFSKHETAFKYVFMLLLLVTGLMFLIMIAYADFFTVIMYVNPIVTGVMAIFSIIIVESDNIPLGTYIGTMLGQFFFLISITILLDMWS